MPSKVKLSDIKIRILTYQIYKSAGGIIIRRNFEIRTDKQAMNRLRKRIKTMMKNKGCAVDVLFKYEYLNNNN